MFNDFYVGKKVFLTGHTGFKGSWLAMWLKHLGAEVKGYALYPQEGNPTHFESCFLEKIMENHFGDIRDKEILTASVLQFQPDIVIHMASQALVRSSYIDPVTTFETNLMGTVNILEAIRQTPSVKLFLNVTSDKVYGEPRGTNKFTEESPFGWHDPYSASKVCSEVITDCYRKSFYNDLNCWILTVRAGNVLGGGDWSENRIVPDLIRSIDSDPAIIRNPTATRPFQHVLDVLYGYLKLIYWQHEHSFIMENHAWNFGADVSTSVITLASYCQTYWKKIQYKVEQDLLFHENPVLELNSEKAERMIRWKPQYDAPVAIYYTIQWYKELMENKKIITMQQIEDYERLVEP